MQYGTYIPKILVIRTLKTSTQRSVQVSDNPLSIFQGLKSWVSTIVSALGFCYWNRQYWFFIGRFVSSYRQYWYSLYIGLYWQYCIEYKYQYQVIFQTLLYSLAQLPLFVLYLSVMHAIFLKFPLFSETSPRIISTRIENCLHCWSSWDLSKLVWDGSQFYLRSKTVMLW